MGLSSDCDSPTDIPLAEQDVFLRRWLVAFTLIVCLAVVAVFAANTLHARNVAVGVARGAAQNLAESLSSQAEDTFEAVDATLLTISLEVRATGTGTPARIRLRDTMAALVTKMPRLNGLTVFDDQGRYVVSNISATPGWTSARKRPYFRYHRTHPISTVYISGPGRLKTQNVWVMFVTRRLDHADGSFAGVAVASITLSYFERTFAGVDVGRSGNISVYADDGMLLVRQPSEFVGRRNLKAGMFIDPYKYQKAGSYIRPSSLDGVVRLFAFRRLGQYPLAIQVALAESEYLANWRTDALKNTGALVCVIALICSLAHGLAVQIGRRNRAEEALARLALIDGLTGIANRRQFDTVLESEWRKATRGQSPLALLMIDVDNFKAYNDRYGHQRGDTVLVAIAVAVAASIVRPSDVVARYGGEEFAVILPATTPEGAEHVAERIRRAVIALGVVHDGTPGTLASVSIGVAGLVPGRVDESSVLVAAADTALYDAKRAGRNRISVMRGRHGPIIPAATRGPLL